MVLSLYAGKLVELQAVDSRAMAETAVDTRTRVVQLPASRGDITDTHGVVLATSVEARNITTDQTLVGDVRTTAAALSPVLGVPEPTLRKKLTGERRFVYLAKGVTPQVWAQVKALGLSGIYSERTSRRVYPAGELAANVVGFVGAEGTGLGGLEYGLQRELAGTSGTLTYEVAGGGRAIPTGQQEGTEPVPGLDVSLTIDRDIQFVAQRAIASRVAAADADGGTVVVMEPSTGRILAMASAPTFNPNKPGESPAAARNNPALGAAFEPGSTSKVMTLAAVIEEKAAGATTHITVPPTLTRAGKEFHDHDEHPTLKLTLTGVLAKSSNIGTILASERIGPQKLYDYLRKFGMGSATGLSFPGETRGALPPPAQWSGTSFPTIAFGQGLSVNAVQAASIFATIANDGTRVTPSLVSSYTQPDGTVIPAQAGESTQVVSPETARTMRAMLESVVSDQGTAPQAAIPGYRVAGKTGTAQVVDPACGCYAEGQYVASFIGMAPADAPRLVVAVNLTNPRKGHYGGVLAGPVFKRVMTFALQQLQVPPTGTTARRLPTTW